MMGFMWEVATNANIKDLLQKKKKPPRLMYILRVYKKCIIMLI